MYSTTLPTLSPIRVAVVFVAVYNFHVMIYLTAHTARRTNHSLILLLQLLYAACSTTATIVQLGHDSTDKCTRSTTRRGD